MTHDERVTQLLEANNRNVERRRAAEAEVRRLKNAIAYVVDGYGLDAPKYKLKPCDIPTEDLSALVSERDALRGAARLLADAFPEDDEDNSIDALRGRYGSEFAAAVKAAREALQGGAP